jgi:hypothetical protein
METSELEDKKEVEKEEQEQEEFKKKTHNKGNLFMKSSENLPQIQKTQPSQHVRLHLH